MSERYSNVFTLQQNLYTVGSPVVIAAGTLLKDNQTGRVVAQLKFRSISNSIIKAVKVKLDLFDTAGNPITEPVVYDYLDLSASRDAEFGQKTPVAIPNNKARSYHATVTEVVFGDKSVWTSNDEPWEALSEPSLLPIDDSELLKQYKMRFGYNCEYAVMEEKDLWHCTCGTWNHKGEDCHVCRNSFSVLQNVDMEELTAAKEKRVAAEVEQETAEKQKRTATKRKWIIRCAITAVVLLVLTIAAQIITSSPTFQDSRKVRMGYKYYKSGEFSKAEREWDFVGVKDLDGSGTITEDEKRDKGFHPSSEELLKYGEDLFYEYACHVARRSFNDAIPMFELILNYKDSADIVAEMRLLLDKYVGEYECISNKVGRTSEELKANFFVHDMRYTNDEFNKVEFDYGYRDMHEHGIYPYKEGYELWSNDELHLYSWDGMGYPYWYKFTFLADNKTFTSTTTFHADNGGKLVYETVWKKIS